MLLVIPLRIRRIRSRLETRSLAFIFSKFFQQPTERGDNVRVHSMCSSSILYKVSIANVHSGLLRTYWWAPPCSGLEACCSSQALNLLLVYMLVGVGRVWVVFPLLPSSWSRCKFGAAHLLSHSLLKGSPSLIFFAMMSSAPSILAPHGLQPRCGSSVGSFRNK